MCDKKKYICFPHKPISIGGPSSFQTRFASKLTKSGYKISYPGSKIENSSSVIIIVGGTRKLFWLLKNKLFGIKIIHRLDGINDYSFNFKDGFKNFIKSRLIHILVNFIRKYVADHVVYQSLYVKNIWENFGGKMLKSSVIYNAVDLAEFKPIKKNLNNEPFSVVVVEGTVQGELALKVLKTFDKYKINVFGNVHNKIMKYLENSINNNVIIHGPIPREEIPKVYGGKKIYLSLEINPACPNSVIEALASGVPVVGFNSGSLKEIVGNGGIILPYSGGNPKKMEPPNLQDLDTAILKIINNYEFYSNLARSRAESFFSLDVQFDRYRQIIEN